jgi:3-phenylpropionate/cinnamic acid dioxygenase small subunit
MHHDGLEGSNGLLAEAIAFIWKEAALLDRKDYEAWSRLWTDDGRYVVPIDPAATDFAATLNYAYDDARLRTLRLQRIMSGKSMSAADAASTVRTVSRFTLGAADEHCIEVHSAQIVVGYKRERHTIYAADLTHRLRFEDGGAPRLQQKIVRLINSADSLDALGFLL